MITFVRSSLLERLHRALSPSYDAKCKAELREGLRWLIEHPEAPCMIEGRIVPNGYGTDAEARCSPW